MNRGGICGSAANWTVLAFAVLACAGLARATASPQSSTASAPSAADSARRDRGAGTNARGSADKNAKRPDLRKLLAAHQVITTDDLTSQHTAAATHQSTARASEAPTSDPALCDAECAAEARDDLGMGPRQEGEWQAQLAAARHNLATDKAWREAYLDGLQKVHMYCVFHDQLRKAALPSGNEYQEQQERGERYQYASDMERTLSQGVDAASARMFRLISDANQVEPVRAAIMRVLASRVLNQCPCGCDP